MWLPKASWVGLSLGSSGMATGTDMIQIDGTAKKAYDKVSSGYQYPSTDTSDDLTATFTDVDSANTYVLIERDLDTNDAQDYVIPTDTEFTIGWAVLTTSSTMTSQHNRDGSFKKTICTRNCTSGGKGGAEVPGAATTTLAGSLCVAASLALLAF